MPPLKGGINTLHTKKSNMKQTFLEYIASLSAKDTVMIEEAEYQGKSVTLNKPFRTPDGPKKFAVYTKNDKGTVVVVRFGDPDMEIKRDDHDRRKSFRARHGCDNPGPKWKARYWSCKFWSTTSVSNLTN